jgi:hypothetical protein
VLDGSKIEMLANLPLIEEGGQETPVPEPCKLPETTRDSYRGVWEFAVDMLPRVCELLETEGLEEIEGYMELYGR